MFCEGIFNCNKVLQRLGHLAAGNGKVARVQEIAYPVVIVKVGLYRLENGYFYVTNSQSFKCLVNMNMKMSISAPQTAPVHCHDEGNVGQILLRECP